MCDLPTDDAPKREPGWRFSSKNSDTNLHRCERAGRVHGTSSTDTRSSGPSSPSTCRPQPSSTTSACLGSQPRACLYRRRPAVHGLLHATPRLRHLLPPRIARRPPRAAPQPLHLPCLQPLIVLLMPNAQTRASCASRATNRSASRSRRRRRRASTGSSARRSV
ncbi:hypothetical protein C8J57DRAFT_1335361 [Mycena rebaudengoi]|nr:hypothetical protein C8J57DRAFT_1335361 [Mycena rebaudengoi]